MAPVSAGLPALFLAMIPSFPNVTTHPSEFPDRIRAAVLGELREGRLPGRLLYQSPRQAQLWLAYHRAYSPSRTNKNLRELYRSAFATAVSSLGEGPLVAISLGCGGGQKDGDLFAEIAQPVRSGSVYVPVDTSPALVREATAHVTRRHGALTSHPLVADLEAEPDVRNWLEGLVAEVLPRLHCAFGLIPNLPPDALLGYLRRQMRRDDRLLLSANQSPGGYDANRSNILSQYDNSHARAWYQGALEDLGIAAGDVDIRVEAVRMSGDGGWWRIEISAWARRNLDLTAFGERIGWPMGKPLLLFCSNRFTAETMQTRLKGAHLPVERAWEGADGEEGIYLCSPAP